MAVTGTLIPLHDNVFVTDMNFDEQVTAGGIVLPSDDGKDVGIKPRWGRVWAIGPEQTDIQLDKWILIEHGRWTRAIEYVEADGSKRKIFRVDTKCILLSANEKPSDIALGLDSIDLSPPEYDFTPK